MDSKPFVMYSSDELRQEALIQSAFVQRLTKSEVDLSTIVRPDVDTIHGAATAVVSYTKEGSPHLDVVSSRPDIIESVKTALEQGASVSPILLEASEIRKIEIMEEEIEAMNDLIARAKAEAEEALNLAIEYEGRGFTEASRIPIPC